MNPEAVAADSVASQPGGDIHEKARRDLPTGLFASLNKRMCRGGHPPPITLSMVSVISFSMNGLRIRARAPALCAA